MSNTITPTVFYRTVNMEGLEIFYREAGPRAVHYGCNANAIPRWHFEEYSSPEAFSRPPCIRGACRPKLCARRLNAWLH